MKKTRTLMVYYSHWSTSIGKSKRLHHVSAQLFFFVIVGLHVLFLIKSGQRYDPADINSHNGTSGKRQVRAAETKYKDPFLYPTFIDLRPFLDRMGDMRGFGLWSLSLPVSFHSQISEDFGRKFSLSTLGTFSDGV